MYYKVHEDVLQEKQKCYIRSLKEKRFQMLTNNRYEKMTE